jgi:hypothetical protein
MNTSSVKEQQSSGVYTYLWGPIDDGGDEAARPAPVGDEVNEDGQLRLEHLRRELALRDELGGRGAPNARARARAREPACWRRAAAGPGREAERGLDRESGPAGGRGGERRAGGGREEGGRGGGARRGRHGRMSGEYRRRTRRNLLEGAK